ncbi:MAG: hypothetical protein HY078_04150 [Elusimicrobia bacterium]|nr:hypothetical protein [Elusimicrobiota bacterium]
MKVIAYAAFAAFLAVALRAPARAQLSAWSKSEIRAAGLRNRIKSVKDILREGSPASRRLHAQMTVAFKSASDRAAAINAYAARKHDLLARADALELELEKTLMTVTPDREEQAAAATEALRRKGETLRADFDLYVALPAAAIGTRGDLAQAAMRMLSQTGQYPVVRTYYEGRRAALTPEERAPLRVPLRTKF